MTPALALDPATDESLLWFIAQNQPLLRHWLIANPASSPELLEYVAQVGGPGVEEGFAVLFDDAPFDDAPFSDAHSNHITEEA
jgi:hypothetical protein